MKSLNEIANLYKYSSDDSVASKALNGPHSIISAKIKNEIPIIANKKWQVLQEPKRLNKLFLFKDLEKRNRFVAELLVYEITVGHHSIINIDQNNVEITVSTKDIDTITELDKEYIRYVDSVYKSLIYQ